MKKGMIRFRTSDEVDILTKNIWNLPNGSFTKMSIGIKKELVAISNVSTIDKEVREIEDPLYVELGELTMDHPLVVFTYLLKTDGGDFKYITKEFSPVAFDYIGHFMSFEEAFEVAERLASELFIICEKGKCNEEEVDGEEEEGN